MPDIDRKTADKIMLTLEQYGLPDDNYRIYTENEAPVLLGTGADSYVYEVVDAADPQKHYALKVVGLTGEPVKYERLVRNVEMQFGLSEQTDTIVRIITLYVMKVALDEEFNVTACIGVNDPAYDAAEGITVCMLLTEKLEPVIRRDKYGKRSLFCNEDITEELALLLAEDIGEALFLMHENNILHRDVKLENIFYDPELERFKLGDFGIVRNMEPGGAETVVFTDGYGAPEIERALQKTYNATADIYSFGITLFLLLNDLKFPASDGYYPNPVQYTEDFIMPAPLHASEELAEVIRNMCAFRPQDRYQSVAEVFVDIDAIEEYYYTETATGENDGETGMFTETATAAGTLTETATVTDIAAGEASEDTAQGENAVPWWMKLDRRTLKRLEKADKTEFFWRSIPLVLLTALFTCLSLRGFSENAGIPAYPEYWFLPAALLVTAIFQRMREFHISSSILTVVLAVFAAVNNGPDIAHIIAIAAAVSFMPALTVGCSLGIVLWLLITVSGKFQWISFMYSADLGWIALLLLFAVALVIFWRTFEYFLDNEVILGLTMIISWAAIIVLTVGGIVLFFISRSGGMQLPAIILRLHPVRTGLGCLVIKTIFEVVELPKYYRESTDTGETEENDDKPLDE